MKQICLLFFLIIPFVSEAAVYNVLDFGAKCDSAFDNRIAFQAAIDKAYENGGGTVIIPSGRYMLSGIDIKSNITLELQAGVYLLASKDLGAYVAHPGINTLGNKVVRKFMISVFNAVNVTICGKGIIDGQGKYYWLPDQIPPAWIKAKNERPNALLEVTNSENVTIRDIILIESPHWTCHILHCKNVIIDGITIDNSLYAPNADGIDITGSKLVRVSNCNIKTCDDAIVLKTWMNGESCEDITVTNCTMETLCVALKIGTESYKDFKRIAFSNCSVKAASRIFAMYVFDGGTAENIVVDNITGTTNAPLVLNRPIHLMLSKRNTESRPGKIRNIFMSNMIFETDGRIMMTAIEDSYLENIRISNLHLSYPFIENPEETATNSSQFPTGMEHITKAKAAIVAKNVMDLYIDKLTIYWPGKEVPEYWRTPVRIVNGDFDKKFKPDYSNPRQAEFSVLYGENLVAGKIDLSNVKSSSSEIIPYIVKESSIIINK